MTPSKGITAVLTSIGLLVWGALDPTAPVGEEYIYDPAAAVPPDLFQAPPVSSARTADGNGFDQLRADLERDDSTDLDLIEVHIEYIKHEVVEGDSLWRLQDRFDVPYELIYEFNRSEIERNFARRCGEPTGLQLASLGHCSTPEATLQKGMILKIPTDIWVAPIRSYKM